MKVPLEMASRDDSELARRMVVWGREPVYCSFEWVPLSLLVATQDEVADGNVEHLRRVSSPPAIDVALIAGRYVVVEGHHRATAAVISRHSSIYASVRSLTPTAPEPSSEEQKP